jgi:hypothetical protein
VKRKKLAMSDNEKVKEDGARLLTAFDVAEHYLTPKARREIAKQIPRGENEKDRDYHRILFRDIGGAAERLDPSRRWQLQ